MGSARILDLDTSTQVLLACVRAAASSSIAELDAFLRSTTIEWSEVDDIASRHGVRPLLYQSLSRVSSGAVPRPVLDELRIICAAIARRNLKLAAELIRLLAALDAAGIAAFPFKGPVLAVSAYGNLALREFVDLDVMVHRADMPRARDLLRALGYAPGIRLNWAQDDIVMRFNGEYDLISADQQVALDVHWAFSSRYIQLEREPRDLWKRLTSASLGSAQVKTLSAADLLVVLCLHGSKACWAQLKWICDVAQVSRRMQASDWEEVIGRAAAWGAERPLLLGLRLARDLLGTPLPDAIEAAGGADRTVDRLATKAKVFLSADAREPLTRAKEARFYAGLSRTTATRLRVWAGLLLMPTWEDAAHLTLTRRLRFLYYVVRPFRLLLKRLGHHWAPASSPQPTASGG